MTQQQQSMRQHQRKLFSAIFVGYAFYVLCRKSFSFVIPDVQSESKLAKEDLGTIVSSLNLAYAISKFVLGVLSDHISAKILFCFGLFSTSLTVVGFSRTSSVFAFSSFWFLNGLAQGCGWPACSKLLRKWFRPEQFGTWWSVLSASINVTGALVPLILPFLLFLGDGWRGFMLISGTASILWAFLCCYLINNSPEDVGLPPIDVITNKKKTNNKKSSSGEESTLKDLLQSSFLWLLSFYYLVTFAAKTSCENWAQLLIVDDKQLPIASATRFVSAFEFGGIVSSFATGYLTDLFVARSVGSKRKGNPRMVLVVVYTILSIVALHFIATLNDYLPIFAFVLGASLYGNINIFGIVATEAAPINLSGTSHAIVSLAANIGAVLAGYPFSVLADKYGWTGVFVFLELVSSVCLVLLIVTRNISGKIAQKEE